MFRRTRSYLLAAMLAAAALLMPAMAIAQEEGGGLLSSPDTIQTILVAIVSTLGLTQAGKKLLERLVTEGSAALPGWVKAFVLPVVAAAAIMLSTGTTDALGDLPAQGITVPAALGLLSSLIYRLVKGKSGTAEA